MRIRGSLFLEEMDPRYLWRGVAEGFAGVEL